MKCTICDGEFPEGKHHTQCYSLDFNWDLEQIENYDPIVYTFIDLFCGIGAFHQAFKKCETDTIKYK